MTFKGKPNTVVTDRNTSRVIGQFDVHGYLDIPNDKILKEFEDRMNNGGYKTVTLRHCECGEPFEDQGSYMTHCKTCKTHIAAKEQK